MVVWPRQDSDCPVTPQGHSLYCAGLENLLDEGEAAEAKSASLSTFASFLLLEDYRSLFPIGRFVFWALTR